VNALVTGGAVRVGRSISLGLAGAGYRVVVHYRGSTEAAESLVAEIRDGGGSSIAVQGDLARLDEVERVAREAEAAFGGVDLLVNNASVFPEERIGEVDEPLWDHTLAVNLKAPFFLTQALAPGMRARGSGVVVNIADLAGVQAWKGYAVHGISKAGLIHFTRIAARALAPEVRVAAVAPGTVLPPESATPHEVEQLARRTPLQRIGSPEDVVRAVLYLARADFVTGTVLTVDGGRAVADGHAEF
jgi:pteridine reductase